MPQSGVVARSDAGIGRPGARRLALVIGTALLLLVIGPDETFGRSDQLFVGLAAIGLALALLAASFRVGGRRAAARRTLAAALIVLIVPAAASIAASASSSPPSSPSSPPTSSSAAAAGPGRTKLERCGPANRQYAAPRNPRPDRPSR
jgi:hypothetical protein